MIINSVTELTITAVQHSGVPNQECIVLRVDLPVDLGQFGLMLGRHYQGNRTIPYFDNLFWFGDGVVKPGDWLLVYTGSGKANRVPAANGVNEIFNLFWGKPTTLFVEPTIAPILFRVDAADVLAPPGNQPQLNQLQNQ